MLGITRYRAGRSAGQTLPVTALDTAIASVEIAAAVAATDPERSEHDAQNLVSSQIWVGLGEGG